MRKLHFFKSHDTELAAAIEQWQTAILIPWQQDGAILGTFNVHRRNLTFTHEFPTHCSF